MLPWPSEAAYGRSSDGGGHKCILTAWYGNNCATPSSHLKVLLLQLKRHGRRDARKEHARERLCKDDRLGFLSQVTHDKPRKIPEKGHWNDSDSHDTKTSLSDVTYSGEVSRPYCLRRQRVNGIADPIEPRISSGVAIHVCERRCRKGLCAYMSNSYYGYHLKSKTN